MTATIGSNTSLLLGYAAGTYGQKSTTATAKTVQNGSTTTTTKSGQSATSLSLSEEAKAYLAGLAGGTSSAADDAATASAADIAAKARSWLDQQYKSLGITSALVDGQTAVDFGSQTRTTLAVIAANTGNQFTADEQTAAAKTLQARFNAALAPHMAIARHTGDYASLYQAASDYLDDASATEKASDTWTKQKQAVSAGLAAARASFGKAPAGNSNDPVRALLDASASASASTSTTTGATTTASTVAKSARSLLDAQANKARDAGTELVFDRSRKSGQQVDFDSFDNRTLAVMALNKDSQFSAEEARAARTELDQRTRSSLLKTMTNSSDVTSQSSALLSQYQSMSAEERSVLGFGDNFANSVLKNYRSVLSLQNTLNSLSSTSLVSYL